MECCTERQKEIEMFDKDYLSLVVVERIWKLEIELLYALAV